MSKGLEALESLETEYYTENNKRILNFNANDKRLDTIEKELKAFDIIKKKEVDIFALTHFIKCCNDKEAFKEYNNDMFEPYQLTKEEFDLLKEVLKNE